MTLALAATIVAALLARWGRIRARRAPRRVAPAAVIDGICALSLFAIPVLGALVFVDHRPSEPQTVRLHSRSTPSTAPVDDDVVPDRSDEVAVGLPNTGAGPTGASGDVADPGLGLGFDGEPTVCRNSVDPECGPFHWDPPPGPNSPVEITISHSPAEPRVGEAVAVTVRVRDLDARIGDVTVTYGDESVSLIPPATNLGCLDEKPSGPWTPPEPAPEEVVRTFRHTYTKVGDLRLSAYAASPEILNATCLPNPYASQGTASIPIRVRGA